MPPYLAATWTAEIVRSASQSLPTPALVGKISDFITTGTAPERVEDRTDVDIVELLEFEAVDRDDRIVEFHFFAIMNSHEFADIAVAGEHDGMAVSDDRIQSIGDSLAEVVEPPKGRRSAPGYEDRDGAFGRRRDRAASARP